jgi:hypothetical protein
MGERLPGFGQYPCAAGARLPDSDGPIRDHGFRVPDIHARDADHWRHEVDPSTVAIPLFAFRAVVDRDMRPRRLAGLLQREFGDHPVKKRPWTRQAVLWMLTNPLYMGQRKYNRTSSISLGRSNRRRRNGPADVVVSKTCENLIVVPPALFEIVQQKLLSWGLRRRKENAVGRPPTTEHLFHKCKLLRCALCGHPLQVTKTGEKYLYTCNHLSDVRGLPRCQSHPAEALDVFVLDSLAEKFARIAEWGEELRAAVSSGRGRTRNNLAELQIRQGTLKDEIRRMRATYLAEAGAMTADDREGYKDVIEEKKLALRVVEEQIVAYATSDDGLDSETREALALVDSVEGFSSSTLYAQRMMMGRVFGAVWIWPDRAIWIQWRDEEEDKVGERTGGRSLREALRWATIDWDRMAADIRRLMRDGEIPQAAFHAEVGESTVYSFCGADGSVRSTPRTLIRMLRVALDEYVDMLRLRQVVEQWIAERLAEGWSWYRFGEACPVHRATVQKIASGRPVARQSWFDIAKMIGGVEQFRVTPDWVYMPPLFEELVAWFSRAEPVAVSDSSDTGESARLGDPSDGNRERLSSGT